MSIGEAKRLSKETGKKVLILDRFGRPVKSDLFNDVPYIMPRPIGQHVRMVNGPGVRPYIQGKTETHWVWKPYMPIPADIVFTPEEKAFAEPYRGMVMIEPTVKRNSHRNKAWSDINWSQLDSMIYLKQLCEVVQCGASDTRFLLHAKPVITSTFRKALAVMSVCKAFVGTEGGLSHGAAAVKTPAVILWSEFVSPEITGYNFMRNIRHAGKPCGSRQDCEGCRKSMLAITPTEVFNNLREILE